MYSSSYDYKLKAQKLNLDKSRYWHLLLHIKNSKSEIDDKSFFISKDGRYNPQAELNATIDAFFHEKRFDDKSFACRFPARKEWLKKTLNIDDFVDVECKDYNDMLKKLSPTSATLVFPASHINSPASMFGHTFIRINSKYKSKLLAYAINYAADANPQKENGVTFAIKGLFGGYYGKYSLLPYYEKLKEYRDTENRDIWEYNLNLTKDEVMKMVRHIWELNGTKSRYYFFTKNCSYNMLWLIEIARESVHLREHFYYEVIPLETVHVVYQENLVKSFDYRASKRTILLKYETLIYDDYMKYILEIQKDILKIDTILNQNLPLIQKQYILEASIEYLQYRYSKNLLTKDEYLSMFYKLSKARASLGKGKKLQILQKENILNGHRAFKLDIGSIYDSDYMMLFGFRPAYHSLDDFQYGFLRGTQIEFFDIKFKTDSKNIKVEDITILSIISLAQRTKLFHPISWRTKISINRDNQDNNLDTLTTVGAGYSWGNDIGYIYTMLDPFYYINSSQVGVGMSVGLSLDKMKFYNLHAELTKRLYLDKKDRYLGFISQGFSLSKNKQLSLKYVYNEYKHNKIELFFNYYF